MRVALLQMTSGIVPADNADVVAAAITEAAARGATMLFTPEMTGLLDRDPARLRRSAATAEADVTLAAVRAGAAAHKIWVHLGSLATALPGGQFANRSFVIDRQGAVTVTYDKIHCFDVTLPSGDIYRESATYVAGRQAVCTPTPLGRLGLTICYDVRFPGLFRTLAQAGAVAIAVPSAFTVPTGEAHWHTLLRARAIETGAYIIAAAQAGTHLDGRTTYGHSLVVSPWGDVMLDMAQQPGLGLVDLDMDAVGRARAAIPAWQLNMPFAAPAP